MTRIFNLILAAVIAFSTLALPAAPVSALVSPTLKQIAETVEPDQQTAIPTDTTTDLDDPTFDTSIDVDAIQESEQAVLARVNVALLNVREGPGLSYQVISQLAYGAVHSVIDGPLEANGFSWLHLDFDGSAVGGWVASTYLTLLTESVPTSTTLATATPYRNIQAGDRVRVDVGVLNVRSGAGTTYPVVSQVRLGQTYSVLAGPVFSSGSYWVLIDLPGSVDGWVAAQYLTRVDSAQPTATLAPTLTFTPTATPSPSLSPTSTPSPVLSPTATITMTVTASPTVTHTATSIGTPTQTSSPSATSTATTPAAISPTATRPAGVFLPGDRVEVIPRLNIRTGPGMNYAIRRVAQPGEVATVLTGNTPGGQISWIQVRFSDVTGWVSAGYVALLGPASTPTITPTKTTTSTPSATAQSTPTKSAGVFQQGDKIVVREGLNVRSGAGTGFSILAVAAAGTQGTVLSGNTQGGSYQWIRVQFPNVTGWVATDWVTHLGMTTPTPIASTSKITVALNCTSNPERITITNNNSASITIISIGTLYDPLASEPFVLNQILGAGLSRTYLAGSLATGQFSLTTSHILTDSAGSNEGVTVVTSAGTVTQRCSAATSTERWVEVDLSEQYMRVYQGSTLIAGTYVSTGRYGFDTPVGTYRTWLKYTSQTMTGCIQGECYRVPNVPWVQYFTYQGHALHGAYWHNNFGVRMSHGCVNLPVPFSEWLYYWLPMNSRVVVKQ